MSLLRLACPKPSTLSVVEIHHAALTSSNSPFEAVLPRLEGCSTGLSFCLGTAQGGDTGRDTGHDTGQPTVIPAGAAHTMSALLDATPPLVQQSGRRPLSAAYCSACKLLNAFSCLSLHTRQQIT